MGANVERPIQYLVVTLSAGLWEDADMDVGQRGVHKTGTEKSLKGAWIPNSYSHLAIVLYVLDMVLTGSPDLT